MMQNQAASNLRSPRQPTTGEDKNAAGAEGGGGGGRKQASTPGGTHLYSCECGFKGAFNQVVIHERTCPTNLASAVRITRRTPARGNGASGSSVNGDSASTIMSSPADATPYVCEWKCGFKGAWQEVAVHEKTCALRQTGATKPSIYKVFVCEFQCGFKGLYDEVQQHERTCAVRPGAPTHTCAYLCGFNGSLHQVSQHERVCVSGMPPLPSPKRTLAPPPETTEGPAHEAPAAPARGGAAALAYVCQFRCGFKASYDEVALHEYTCGCRDVTQDKTRECHLGEEGLGTCVDDSTVCLCRLSGYPYCLAVAARWMPVSLSPCIPCSHPPPLPPGWPLSQRIVCVFVSRCVCRVVCHFSRGCILLLARMVHECSVHTRVYAYTFP
jgi:hypothetical protein